MKYKKRHLLLIKRKHLKYIIIAFVAVVAVVTILLVTSANNRRSDLQNSVDAVAETGVIHIGLRGDIGSLCTYNSDTGVYEGLEKDVVDEIIRRLFGDEIIVNYTEVNSETKDAMLKLGEIDISLGASVNLGSSGISYTSSFYSDGNAFLVMEDSISRIQALTGKSIAVVQGSNVAEDSEKDEEVTVLEEYLSDQGIQTKVKKYASYPEAINALRSGHVNGVCANEISLKLYGIKGMLILPDRFLPVNYCVQVREDLGAFYTAIDEQIKSMQADGTMDSLIEKWNLINYASLE